MLTIHDVDDNPVATIQLVDGKLAAPVNVAGIVDGWRRRWPDLDDAGIFEMLSTDGWTNGYLFIGGDEVSRAAGHDVTPGHDQLHHYWTADPKGRARWVDSPTPWTTLEHLLEEHVEPEMAKRLAASFFHDVFHYWPGDDKNRVAHGKPPRGKKIGPG